MQSANKYFLRFVFSFCCIFLLCYFGIKFLTGFAVEGGNYSPFVAKYLDIASWTRDLLLFSTKIVVRIFGYETYRESEYIFRISGGGGIKIVYSCLGFAVMSFWIAYTIASKAELNKKIIWLFSGLLILWIINVIRISLVLIGTTKNWRFPFGWDHHTWFNIIAYGAIFTMMYFFEKNIKNKSIES